MPRIDIDSEDLINILTDRCDTCKVSGNNECQDCVGHYVLNSDGQLLARLFYKYLVSGSHIPEVNINDVPY